MLTKHLRIGVFDSGIGGLSVASAIDKAFSDADVIFVNDSEHVPYGTKSNEELLKLSLPFLEGLESRGCDIIVIACNTISTTIIGELRHKLRVPLVGIEPMIKPAAVMTKSKIIAVCATPSTLASKRYAELKNDFAKDIIVLEPNCSNWAELIEKNSIDQQQITDTINSVINKGSDVIVLGCTHYHWIEQDIKKIAGDKAIVLQPEAAIIMRLRQVLKQLV